MTEKLLAEVVAGAQRAELVARERGGGVFDYSLASLTTVEEILAETSAHADQLGELAIRNLARDFGSYVLEVGRRNFGGYYSWFDLRNAPVLVTGEPSFHVAILSWEKTRGRLAGDVGDNIPFFFEGYSERVRAGLPGDHVLFV